MKVILLADVPKVGNCHQVKDLKAGFAQNALIARGLAVLATPQALAKLESKKAEVDKKKEEEVKTFSSLIASVGNKKIIVKAKANEKGHLFKAIGPQDVARAIKEIAGVEVDKKSITVDHIKNLGTHSVVIKKGDKEGKCEIIIEAE